MPSDFTGLMAEQITEVTGIECVEGKGGLEVEAGKIYVAPGDYHMTIHNGTAGKHIIKLNQDAPENFCRPSANPMLRSLADSYGAKKILSVVLTGMGHDGLAGCEMISKNGGIVMAQDYESSAVWGMPGSVAKAGICSFILSPEELAEKIMEIFSGRLS